MTRTLWILMVLSLACSREEPSVEPPEEPLPTLEEAGCTAASISTEIGEGNRITIPNIFSPDYDGMNDIFKPFFYFSDPDTVLDHYRFKVEDRSGQLLFSTDDWEKPWEGTDLDGEYVADSIYVYTIELELGGTPYRYQGEVTVIRPAPYWQNNPEGQTYQLQNCSECIFPDQIMPRLGAIYPTNQELERVCL